MEGRKRKPLKLRMTIPEVMIHMSEGNVGGANVIGKITETLKEEAPIFYFI